jgi:hypothetical protein
VKRRLSVFIGGSDEQNGDYSLVHRLAQRGGTANWSSFKDSTPGDLVLIYIQRPHSALIAKAEVLADAKKTRPGDSYRHRAKIGYFELLPNRVDVRDLKHSFPQWRWLRLPRGKAIVPARYADQLWNLVHRKNSNVQIIISNATHGKKLLESMAAKGRTAFWHAPRLTAAGDELLFYVEEPVSAIVATGKAVSATRKTSKKWHEVKVGGVRLLDMPITLPELRNMFPDWGWLRSVNMFAYVNSERSRALLKRCDMQSPPIVSEPSLSLGGGFGGAKTNALVEKAAVRIVAARLKRDGFTVRFSGERAPRVRPRCQKRAD